MTEKEMRKKNLVINIFKQTDYDLKMDMLSYIKYLIV